MSPEVRHSDGCQCQTCHRTRYYVSVARDFRLADERREKKRQRDREYNKRRPGRTSRTKASERIRNKVRWALQSGRLVRPGICQGTCGRADDRSDPARRLSAHHDDHRRVYDVLFLCARCHAARHVELGRVGKRKSRRPGRKK